MLCYRNNSFISVYQVPVYRSSRNPNSKEGRSREPKQQALVLNRQLPNYHVRSRNMVCLVLGLRPSPPPRPPLAHVEQVLIVVR